MRKYFLPTILFLLGLVLMVPISVLAADDVVISGAVNVYIADPGVTLTISDVTVDQIEVSATTVIITMPIGTDNAVTVTASPGYLLPVSGIVDPGTACGASTSSVVIPSQYGEASAVAVTVNPGDACPPAGGGGAVSVTTPTTTPTPTTTTPTTTTGEVTATASAGGTTSVVSDEVTASVEIPAEAIAADTTVTIAPTATTETAVATAVAAVPSTKSVVGGKVYNYSATSGGIAVSTFDSAVTVSISYTDAQISGLQLSSLKIHYWNEITEAWVALTSVVNTADKTITASVDHFTYFAILGLAEGEEAEEETEETTEEPTTMTIEEMKARIVELLALVKQLQAQLGIPSVSCSISSFNRTLKKGMSGDDVKCLQIILNSDSSTQVASTGVGSPGKETNYFGSLTNAAAIKFQEKYTSEVLSPWGLTNGTGLIGSTTRAKLDKMIK